MFELPQGETPKPLDRKERIALAWRIHGLYTLGMAVTASEIVDENCAMDNAGVPYYEHQLTENHKDVIADLHRNKETSNMN